MKTCFLLLFIFFSSFLKAQKSYTFDGSTPPRVITGFMYSTTFGYANYNVSALRNWMSKNGCPPIGGNGHFDFHFSVEMFFDKIMASIECEAVTDYTTLSGPNYDAFGIRTGYVCGIHDKIFIIPNAGIYVGKTSMDFFQHHPAVLTSVYNVPEHEQAMLYQYAYYASPGIKLYYMLRRDDGLYLEFSAGKMIGIGYDDWKYGYAHTQGKHTTYYLNNANIIPTTTFSSGWNIMIGIGLGVMEYMKI